MIAGAGVRRIVGTALLVLVCLVLAAFLAQWAFELWIQVVEPVVDPWVTSPR